MNRRTLFFLALPLCASCLLEAQLNPPKTGVVRYGDGTVHAVYGLPANYIVEGQALASADAVSFSNAGGLLAKNGRIQLVDAAFKTVAEYESGEAAPLLNMDAVLTSAVAWLPQQHALLHWNGSSFVLTEVNGMSGLGIVTSLRLARGNTVELLLIGTEANVSEATVSLASGELISLNALPGVRGPAALAQSFVVFRDERGLSVATASEVIETFPLPALASSRDLSFERMSSNALHIMSASQGQNWILHLDNPAKMRLAQLPAALLTTTLSEVKQ